ncbi:MAG: ABC transporter substrate-binding protein [Campylobacteraceae bacterium]|jgi:NitT/TauT family transport system substrate-binding protein|nr:ABC transporter substrate-binding protein [Campylobacteraceae bacterium]
MKKVFLSAIAFVFLFDFCLSADKNELKVAKQYVILHLPLIVVEEHGLIEKNAKALELKDIKVKWVTLSGGSAANNDVLPSGSVDLISGAIRLWDKTKGKAKILASLNEAPQILNTSNPKIKTLRDFTDKDKIAAPSVKVSIQSLVSQIATAKEYGIENYDKLDYLTVALKHSNALAVLTSDKSEIAAHFTQEPFLTIEQQNPNIHQVFDFYDVFGGRHTSNVISTTEEFYKNNPKLSQAIIDALNEVDFWIANNKKEASKLYLQASKSKEHLEIIETILNKPEISYQTKPLPNITVFSDFLFDTGAIKTKPSDWKELVFDKIH